MNTLRHLISESQQLVDHLNCANCQWADRKKVEPVNKSEVNNQGGIICPGGAAADRALASRLITLPGKAATTSKSWCNHPGVDQWVTERMWCTLWEAPGMMHSFKSDK